MPYTRRSYTASGARTGAARRAVSRSGAVPISRTRLVQRPVYGVVRRPAIRAAPTVYIPPSVAATSGSGDHSTLQHLEETLASGARQMMQDIRSNPNIESKMDSLIKGYNSVRSMVNHIPGVNLPSKKEIEKELGKFAYDHDISF